MGHFITAHADTLLNVGLELLLKSTVILTLGLAITLIARKASAAAKHMLWTTVMATLLALPVIIALAPQWQILPRWQTPVTPTIILPMPDPLPSTPDARRPQATWAPLATDKPTPPTITPPLQLPWQLYPLLLYLLGSLLTLSPMLIALAWFHRLQRTARPLPTWNPLLADTRRRLNTCRPITLLESPHIHMPMTFGTLHPRILLPPEAAAWTTEKRRLVLLHETAHIVRLDVLTHTLAGFVRALYWFHPLIWLAHWQMALEAERAADDECHSHKGVRANGDCGVI